MYEALATDGTLKMRVRATLASEVADDEAEYKRLIAIRARFANHPLIRANGVKIFSDGVIEYPTQTAAMIVPYYDGHGHATTNHGERYFKQSVLNAYVTRLDAEGFTVHTHSIGDYTTRAVLDALAYARRQERRDRQPPPDLAPAGGRSGRLPALCHARRRRQHAALLGAARCLHDRCRAALHAARSLRADVPGGQPARRGRRTGRGQRLAGGRVPGRPDAQHAAVGHRNRPHAGQRLGAAIRWPRAQREGARDAQGHARRLHDQCRARAAARHRGRLDRDRQAG